MTLAVSNLFPIPLQEKFLNQHSGIWNQDLLFNKGARIKIKAGSGSGKTTFVHIIYKVRTDYKGSVQWNTNNLSEINMHDLALLRQKHISIIFQDLRLFSGITALENIQLNKALFDSTLESANINAMASRLGIQHILDQEVALCSYGEQQRIAILRALIQPFDWLIMDEPFSHLDDENILKASALIQEVCDQQEAGFIIMDLEDDDHFAYTQKITM